MKTALINFLANPILVLGTLSGFCIFGIVYMLQIMMPPLYLAILAMLAWFIFLENYNRENKQK